MNYNNGTTSNSPAMSNKSQKMEWYIHADPVAYLTESLAKSMQQEMDDELIKALSGEHNAYDSGRRK